MFTRAYRNRLVSARPRPRRFVVATVALAALVVASQALAGAAAKPEREWPMIGRLPTNTPRSALRAQDQAQERGPAGAEMGGDDDGGRFGNSGGRGRSRLLRGLRRHRLEAGRRDRRDDLVALGPGLHRHRRGLRAHEPVARRRHARRRRDPGPESRRPDGPNMLGIDAKTGAVRWATQIHPDRRAVMTGSPILSATW